MEVNFVKSTNKPVKNTHMKSSQWRFTLSLPFNVSAVQRCSVKKVFLEVSQNSQENACARVSFLIKLQALADCFCLYYVLSHNVN